jgi:hypothetical protein
MQANKLTNVRNAFNVTKILGSNRVLLDAAAHSLQGLLIKCDT